MEKTEKKLVEMAQVARASNEVNASIMKSFLESNGIRASYSSSGSRYGIAASCIVYCDKEKIDEATKLLKDQGLIVS